MSGGRRLRAGRFRTGPPAPLPWLILLSLIGTGTASAQPPVTPDRVLELFDGRSLDGFYTWLVDHGRDDPKRVFGVVDQIDGAPAIRISGEVWGGLVTRRAYRDFHLVVEFRWGPATWGARRDAARDSGILIHCQGPDGNTAEDFNGPWMRSVEAQIIEGGVGDLILVAGYDPDKGRRTPAATAKVAIDRDGEPVFDPEGQVREFEGGRVNWSGRDPDWEDRLGFRGRNDLESPYGEWTRLEVTADGDRITHRVNGEIVLEARSSLSEGKILIQSEGAEIYFRRIELRPLDF